MRHGRRPEIHHSDQGVQYAATAYTELLAGRGVAISMAAVGKPEENGFAERLMRTIREEEIDLSEYRDFADAYGQLGRFLDDVYDRKRIHSSLRYLTPREFEQQLLRGGKPRPCTDRGANPMASRLRSGSDGRAASRDAISLPDSPPSARATVCGQALPLRGADDRSSGPGPGLAHRTAERGWLFVRAWLFRHFAPSLVTRPRPDCP